MSSPAVSFYEFGPYSLDARERVLLREGEIVRLTPKEFETLLALVRGGGRVLSKEELLKEIWHDTFVGEATLAQNVFTLRKALGEAEGGKSYIETVPRRGYRFAARVREVVGEESKGETDEGAELMSHAASNDAGGKRLAAVPDRTNALNLEGARANDEQAPLRADSSRETSDGHADAAQFASPSTTTTPAPAQNELAAMRTPEADGHPVRAAVLITVAVLVAVALVVYLIFRFSVRPDDERRAPAFESMKVTRLPVPGTVTEAAISPDGKSFICTYGFSPASSPKLAVVPIEGGQPTKLFDIGPSFRANTVWLPDSRGIAFVDSRTGTNNVWMQPLGGGKPVQLTDFKSDGVSAYDFSRDGRLAASRSVETTGVVLVKDFR